MTELLFFDCVEAEESRVHGRALKKLEGILWGIVNENGPETTGEVKTMKVIQGHLRDWQCQRTEWRSSAVSVWIWSMTIAGMCV
jgi:hypothetical protein